MSDELRRSLLRYIEQNNDFRLVLIKIAELSESLLDGDRPDALTHAHVDLVTIHNLAESALSGDY